MVGLIFLNISEKTKIDLFQQSQEQDQKLLVDRILELKGSSLEMFAYDYTFWDEMVNFVKKPTKKWASENIETAMSTYKANMVWIYKKDYSPLYFTSDVECNGLKEISSKVDYSKLFEKNRFCHFFLDSPCGLIEIRGATIHPTADHDRKTLPQGCFIAGRLWNEEYIADISRLTNNSINLSLFKKRAFESSPNQKSGIIELSKILKGWDEKPVANITALKESILVKQFIYSSNRLYVLYIIFGLTILATTFALFTRWVSLPLSMVSRSLNENNPALLTAIQKHKNEFGQLALLVESFFKQKIDLEQEIKEREQAEEKLQKLLEKLDERVKERTEELKKSEERYALATRGANDGLWDWDIKNNKVYFSPRWKSMLGYDEKEIADSLQQWLNLIHPDDVERVRSDIELHLAGKTFHFESEYRMLHRDERYRWILCRGIAIKDEKGNAYRMAGSQTDITERKKMEEQLIHNAFYDSLTNLPNRTLFMDRLGHTLKRSIRSQDYLFAVLFLDIDNFKVINDSLGHLVGDSLLIEVAKRLEICLRPEDTIARLGGDEFAILLEGIKNIDDTKIVAKRIQESLRASFNLEGYETRITSSIGIAPSSNRYKMPEELLRDADIAMYRAKLFGKARYVIFDPSMYIKVANRLQLENDLHLAIERREFLVYYQPILSLETHEVVGIEALLRWKHPEHGIIPPGKFIPVTEETGMIIPIGKWVLRTACYNIKALHDVGIQSIRVSVNISPRQFTHQNFVEMVSKILSETGLQPNFMALEITESMIMNHPEFVGSKLSKLKELGVKICLDDFGTGYSSLNYFQRFPIDELKIDRSFIADLTSDDKRIEVVRTIIMLAEGFGMDTVAEGIETPDQLIQLKLLKCKYGQGYLFSKPLPFDIKKLKELTIELPKLHT